MTRAEGPAAMSGLQGAVRARVAAVFASRAVRSIGVLVSGTATAQAITALAMPVNTRLFTPEDFSAAAVFASLVGMLSVAACLRFDMALALPERDEEAASLLVLAVLLALVAGVACAVVISVLPLSWLELLGEPAVLPWLWLVPLGVTAGGAYLALQMWFVRRGDFKSIALSRVTQSSGAVAAQIGLGVLRVGPLGLIIGQLLNSGAGALLLGASAVRRDWALLRSVTLGSMVRAFSAHRRFPFYSTWEAMANAASVQAPILLIAALATGPEAGYVTLAIFLLQVPMALLGNAIGQVYLSGAPSAHAEKRLAQYTGASLLALVRAATFPMAFLAVVAPVLFGSVFGAPWTRAGVLVSWMVPWFLAQFLTSPISSVLHVTGRQKQAMSLQVAGLGLRVGSVVVAATLSPNRIAEAYALSGLLFYGIYLLAVLQAAEVPWLDARRAFGQCVTLAVVGISAGVLCVVALSSVGLTG